ncbi:MAG: protein kinase [Bacteroidota bacterium]
MNFQDCPCALHEMMLKCWSYDPRKRPDFNDIYTQLNGFVSKPNLLKNTADNSCLSPSDSTTYDAS